MRIFVISIASAADRREAAVRQPNAAGLEFVDAVERAADAFRYFDGHDRRLYKLNTGRTPLPGEIGCYASHKALWNRCIRFSDAHSLSVFFEATNLFNRSNDCCVEYEVDDESGVLRLETEAVNGLPFIPSAGFVWRF